MTLAEIIKEVRERAERIARKELQDAEYKAMVFCSPNGVASFSYTPKFSKEDADRYCECKANAAEERLVTRIIRLGYEDRP